MLGRPARDLLRTLTPFVVAPARHLPMLDLAPFGLKIPRALNTLWNVGGMLYAPPFR